MEYVLTPEERDRVLLRGRGKHSMIAVSQELHEAVNRPLRPSVVTPAPWQASEYEPLLHAEEFVALAIMLGTAAGRFQK